MTNQNGKSSGKKITAAFLIIAVLSALFGIVSGLLLAFGVVGTFTAYLLTLGFAIVIVVISAIFGVILPKNNRKIMELSEKLTRFSNGSIDVSFRTNDSSDIDVLSNKIADVTETLGNVVYDVEVLSKKVKNGDMTLKVDEVAYPGNFKKMAVNLNSLVSGLSEDTKVIADAFKSYVDGDFDSSSLNFVGEKAVYNNIADDMNRKEFFDALDSIVVSACEGDFSRRIDENSYSGGLREFVFKINSLVGSVDETTKELLNVFMEISQLNNFGAKVNGNYKGVFNKIKNAINESFDVIGNCLGEIMHVFKEISEFNLDVSLNGFYKGDFEKVKDYVNSTIGNFNELIGGFESSIKQFDFDSKQIRSASNDLSGKTGRQTDAINRLNIGISKLSQQSVENEKSAAEANEIVAEAKDSIFVGNEQMDSMLSAMNAINDTSNSISNIIKVIDDIAFQTNILALNAAVEAARAGEHGKGFAVVADEVRTLASRTQQAAKEITELIESAIEKISDGSSIAHNTAESLSDIIEKINSISSIIEKTSRISNEQGSEIEKLSKGISEIDSVAREISRDADSMSSNSITKSSDILMESISKFKLKSETSIDRKRKLSAFKPDNGGSSFTESRNAAPISRPIRQQSTSVPKLNISSEQGVKHIPEGVSLNNPVGAGVVSKASVHNNYDIDTIDFDKTTDFGKY